MTVTPETQEIEQAVKQEFAVQAKTLSHFVTSLAGEWLAQLRDDISMPRILRALQPLRRASHSVGLDELSATISALIHFLEASVAKPESNPEHLSKKFADLWRVVADYLEKLETNTAIPFPQSECKEKIAQFIPAVGIKAPAAAKIPQQSAEPSDVAPIKVVNKLPAAPAPSITHARWQENEPGVVQPRYGRFGSSDGRTVLLSEDDHEIREIIAHLLRQAKCRVIEASDGAEALAYLAANPVDLFITDLRMPKLDGVEVIRRSRGYNSQLQVIVISGLADRKDLVHLMHYGIADFIEKPFSGALVVHAVERVLKEEQMRLGINRVAKSILRSYGELAGLLARLENQNPGLKTDIDGVSSHLNEIRGLTKLLMTIDL